MKKLRIGIIGAGNIAQKHLEAIHHCTEIETIGIASRTKAKAVQLQNKFTIPSVYDDVDTLVQSGKPDALMVLVSADQIFEVSKQTIKHGIPLFIEKPAGIGVEQNYDLYVRARKKNIVTMVGFNRRFYSIFHKGLGALKQRGAVRGVYVEGHERMWRVRQNPLVNKRILDDWFFVNSIHCVDLLRFFGGEASEVKSIFHSTREKKFDQLGAVMQLSVGGIGHYGAHWYSPGGWKVILYGDGITVEYGPLEQGRWIDSDFATHDIRPDEDDSKAKPGFIRQLKAFHRYVQSSRKEWPIADLEDSYKTAQLAQAMVEV